MSCEASKASLESSAFAGPSSMLVLPYWRHDEEELSEDLRTQDFSAAISSKWEAVLHSTILKSSLLFAAEVLQQRAKHRPPSTRRSQRLWLNQFQTCFYFEISNVFHCPSSIKKALATSFFLAASTLTLNMFFSYTVSHWHCTPYLVLLRRVPHDACEVTRAHDGPETDSESRSPVMYQGWAGTCRGIWFVRTGSEIGAWKKDTRWLFCRK